MSDPLCHRFLRETPLRVELPLWKRRRKGSHTPELYLGFGLRKIIGAQEFQPLELNRH